jgi:hypothetical protein
MKNKKKNVTLNSNSEEKKFLMLKLLPELPKKLLMVALPKESVPRLILLSPRTN